MLFAHVGGLWKDGDPKNTIGYRGYMEEPHYLCGIAAGHDDEDGQDRIHRLQARSTSSSTTATASSWAPARSTRAVTCQVVITGDWDNPVKEAEDVNSLVDQGVDVIVANVDSPKVAVENAERRGIMSCGYHTDLVALAPKGFLTGAEWNWAAGGSSSRPGRPAAPIRTCCRGGFKQDMVAISPFGPGVPEDVQDARAQGRGRRSSTTASSSTRAR